MTCDLAPNSVGSSYEEKDFVIAVAPDLSLQKYSKE